MKRQFEEFFSFKTLQYLQYLPLIIGSIENWPFFLLNYIGIKDQGGIYIFRNGIKIKTQAGVDSVTIFSIFIKKVYGEVEPNSIVIDIGANIGVYSIFAALKNAMVYSYEPESKNFKLLLENIRLNNFEKNIQPFCIGISGREEERELYLGSSPFHSFYFHQNGGKKTKIKCIPLKKIFEENNIERCDILKIDCEGAEFEILYNTPFECFKKIKKICLEYHLNKNHRIEDLLNFLKEKGFEIIKFKKESKNTGNVWLLNNENRN